MYTCNNCQKMNLQSEPNSTFEVCPSCHTAWVHHSARKNTVKKLLMRVFQKTEASSI